MPRSDHKFKRIALEDKLNKSGFLQVHLEGESSEDLFIVVSRETGEVTLSVGSEGQIFEFTSRTSLNRMAILFEVAYRNAKGKFSQVEGEEE